MDYMQETIKEAKKALKTGNVPVGAVIVKDGVVIAKAHNKRESSNNIHDHAEIIAINKASKKLGTWKLDGCQMYCTVEPCEMCFGAIKQARISTVFFGTESEKNVNYKTEKNNTHNMQTKELMKGFFKGLR